LKVGTDFVGDPADSAGLGWFSDVENWYITISASRFTMSKDATSLT
jgi:hypothetical protein